MNSMKKKKMLAKMEQGKSEKIKPQAVLCNLWWEHEQRGQDVLCNLWWEHGTEGAGCTL